jgi:hypothetical protein
VTVVLGYALEFYSAVTVAVRSDQRYCSPACKQRAYRQRRTASAREA